MMLIDTVSPLSSYTAEQQYDTISDERLIKALCSASMSEWALEKLYERYKRYAYSLAYRILNDSLLAEDVVQDVFLSLWQKALYYREQQGSVKSWLQAIVRNRAIDKIRASQYRDTQCLSLADGYLWEPIDTGNALWEQVWEQEQGASIRRALAQLPTEQRLVIELSYFQGYTHAEIAQLQKVPLGTVKGRMRLGLQKMKQLLEDALS